MRLPRDITGTALCKLLEQFGYFITRQRGSHIRLTKQNPAQHHLTIPNHSPIRLGTLNAILEDVANHLEMSKDELIKRLFY